MSASDESTPGALKDWFNAERYQRIAGTLAEACSRFDRKQFLNLTLDGLAERSLMERLRQTAHAAAITLPGSFATQVKVLRRVAPHNDHNFVGIWFAEFVALRGLDQPDIALPALREFTRYGSAEFAIRRFLLRDTPATLAVMQDWARDEDEHVRRLASEGSRPRLPWGEKLPFVIDDPGLTRPILEQLRSDPSLYVRKSVANHLNDVTKDHPDYVVDLCTAWGRDNEHTAWIVQRGLRTLIKRGNARALALMGAGQAPKVEIVEFTASPRRLRLDQTLQLSVRLRSASRHLQSLIIDYVIHYARPGGTLAAKVFKWRNLSLDPGSTVSLKKRQTIRDFTTRRHYAGIHRVELQVNGRRIAETGFDLRIP